MFGTIDGIKSIISIRYCLFFAGVLVLVLNTNISARTGKKTLEKSKSSLQRDISDLKALNMEARLAAIKRLAAGADPQAFPPP